MRTGKPGKCHPIVIKIAIGAVLCFAACGSPCRQRGGLDLTIVTCFRHLLRAVPVAHNQTSFREFLNSKVGLATGEESGRDVLIEIATVPVTLAVAATLIGLAWVIFG
jgi:hypothetical protein